MQQLTTISHSYGQIVQGKKCQCCRFPVNKELTLGFILILMLKVSVILRTEFCVCVNQIYSDSNIQIFTKPQLKLKKNLKKSSASASNVLCVSRFIGKVCKVIRNKSFLPAKDRNGSVLGRPGSKTIWPNFFSSGSGRLNLTRT